MRPLSPALHHVLAPSLTVHLHTSLPLRALCVPSAMTASGFGGHEWSPHCPFECSVPPALGERRLMQTPSALDLSESARTKLSLNLAPDFKGLPAPCRSPPCPAVGPQGGRGDPPFLSTPAHSTHLCGALRPLSSSCLEDVVSALTPNGRLNFDSSEAEALTPGALTPDIRPRPSRAVVQATPRLRPDGEAATSPYSS